jgi:CRISPR-associated protein Cst2
MKKNLFATILTHASPSSNYRGESEESRTVLQKITKDGKEYTVISPESMRNALREILIGYGLPTNRSRLHDEDQLAVQFKDFPNATKYSDDFLFGYMVADKKAAEAMKKEKIPAKRDSVLRMNLAVALSPYRFNATFHQSPLNVNAGGSLPGRTWQNSIKSALLHREVSHTAYQYPFALNGDDCAKGEGAKWSIALLKAIGELSNVAGGHARSLYEMAPQSIVARLTPSLVAGYSSYGFNDKGDFPELERIHAGDLSGKEFWVGGELARSMPAEVKTKLTAEGVRFFDNAQKMIEDLGRAFTSEAA